MELSQYTEGFAAVICLTLMAGMMLTFALGRRAGVRQHRIDPAGAHSISGAVEGAIFGLLGLLIAFTFDGAADRLEVRRNLIADLEYPSAGFIRIDSADVMLRDLLNQMQSTTDLQVPHD